MGNFWFRCLACHVFSGINIDILPKFGVIRQPKYLLYIGVFLARMTRGKRAQSRIYHETQTENMCALHAINNLLQDAEFTANDLVRIGHELDKHERALYGSISGDVNATFESSNLDPSGNFSIQVIIVALAMYELELVSLNSSDLRAIAAAQNTYNQQAFICHKDDHWFTIRKFGSKWYNLDSLLRYPKRLSDNGIHLSIFATRELTDSYTGIFVVMGNLKNVNMNEPDENDDPDRNYVDSIEISPTSHNQKPQPTTHGDQSNETDRNRTNLESKWKQLVTILQKLITDSWGIKKLKAVTQMVGYQRLQK